MRYLMKQKLFAFGDDFTITDEQGNDTFFVDGRAFSFGDNSPSKTCKATSLPSFARSFSHGGQPTRFTAAANWQQR
jgi:hypothetical protein